MRKPAFFIVGAQKAGTTSLAALLDAVPGITLSEPKEPMFFCFDDFEVHRNEFLHPRAQWSNWRWERDRAELLERYAQCFAHAPEGDLLGEASTTYAPSRRAAERIADTCPAARMIMVLRDPVERAYSAYWHAIRKGVATRTFEEEIRFGGGNLIEFGCYAAQLEQYIRKFGRERVHIAHFEELIANEKSVLQAMLNFLGVEVPAQLPAVPRMNESYYPRFFRLHCLAARLMRRLSDPAPHSVLKFPSTANESPEGNSASASGLRGWYRKMAMGKKRPREMKEETRTALIEFYQRERATLSSLLGEDVGQRWGW